MENKVKNIRGSLDNELRLIIIEALIKAIGENDKGMIEALAWVSHPVTLQPKL